MLDMLSADASQKIWTTMPVRGQNHDPKSASISHIRHQQRGLELADLSLGSLMSSTASARDASPRF